PRPRGALPSQPVSIAHRFWLVRLCYIQIMLGVENRAGSSLPHRWPARWPNHGYIGAAVIIAAELLLFGVNQAGSRWFTAIVWTGYIMFIDALIYRIKGSSLITTDRAELVIMAVISIAVWWVFEFYNAPRFWRSGQEIWWHYHNLEPNPFLRRAGYD